MKRFATGLSVLLSILVMMICIGAPALAEAADETPMLFNATEIVAAAIGLMGVAAAAIFGWLAKQYIIPWIQTNNLEKVADIAVNAAEALFGAGHGTDKWTWAVEYMKKHGIELDQEAIDAAINSAWTKLNLGQITAGIKEADVNVVINPGAKG